MNEFVDELTNHRKFMQNDEEAVDEKLKTQKQAVKASLGPPVTGSIPDPTTTIDTPGRD